MSKAGKESLAASQYVVIRRLKISCIPGIRNISRLVCEIQKAENLLLRITSDDTKDISDVLTVHADQIVIDVIIFSRHLTGCFSFCRYPVTAQNGAGSWMNGIAYFFCAGCGRSDLKGLGVRRMGYEITHNELGHGAAADVAVAYK